MSRTEIYNGLILNLLWLLLIFSNDVLTAFRLIKEFDREIKDEESRNPPEVNKQLNDEKQSMIKELNSYVALRKTYPSTLGHKRVEIFDIGAGASEPTAAENVQMASETHFSCMLLYVIKTQRKEKNATREEKKEKKGRKKREKGKGRKKKPPAKSIFKLGFPISSPFSREMSNQELMNAGMKTMDETDQAIERLKQVVHQTVEVGTQTASTLKDQTDKWVVLSMIWTQSSSP
ncbi:t-SNARE coiled-coil-like proteiny domain-containing protein [Forsythia ovata]|uniref:t-SNARE coiled-coil-like proteiny domain-containing protein n=1 Tax=Forsythia ovata TaxID=205694 RepID=A0ABD1PN81_9LAMI